MILLKFNSELQIMRRFILCLLLGTFLSGTLIAQKGFKIGGFVLPQAVWLMNQDDAALSEAQYQLEPLGGMGVGLQLGYNTTTNFGVRLNVLYSQQGGKYSFLNQGGNRVSKTTRLGYLEVPLMIGVNSNHQFNKIIFALYGGVQLGVLATANEYDDNTEFQIPISDLTDTYPTLLQAYSDMDLSFVADAGIDVKLNYDLMLNLHLRLNYGLQDAEDKDAFVRINDQGNVRTTSYWDFIRDMNNRGITRNVNLGLMIGLTYTFVQE